MSQLLDSIYEKIAESQILQNAGKFVKKGLQTASQSFGNTVPGKIIDLVITQPVKNIIDVAEPMKASYDGLMAFNQGLGKIGQGSLYDGSIWQGPKQVAGGLSRFIGNSVLTLPAIGTAGFSLIPTAIAGKLGHMSYKGIRDSQTRKKMLKRRGDLQSFKKQAKDLTQAYGATMASNWVKMRNKNIEGKLQEKREQIQKKDDKNQKEAKLFINVDDPGFPNSKELARMDKKDIVASQNYYNELKAALKQKQKQ